MNAASMCRVQRGRRGGMTTCQPAPLRCDRLTHRCSGDRLSRRSGEPVTTCQERSQRSWIGDVTLTELALGRVHPLTAPGSLGSCTVLGGARDVLDADGPLGAEDRSRRPAPSSVSLARAPISPWRSEGDCSLRLGPRSLDGDGGSEWEVSPSEGPGDGEPRRSTKKYMRFRGKKQRREKKKISKGGPPPGGIVSQGWGVTPIGGTRRGRVTARWVTVTEGTGVSRYRGERG